MQDFSECQSHSSQSREDAIQKLTQALVWREKNGTGDSKLTEDATLQFLYKTSRLKDSYKSTSGTKTPYSQCQREFRASTNKFSSKAIPRRHLQKNLFSAPCARQRLLKQLPQDRSLAGHCTTASSLFLTSSRV